MFAYEDDCTYTVGTVSGTTSIDGSSSTLSTTLTLGGSEATGIQWQYKPSSSSTWVNALNSSATSAAYSTAYLGRSHDFRAVLTKSGVTCHSVDEGVGPKTVTVNNASNLYAFEGGTSTAWGTAANWSTGSVPANSTTARVLIGNEQTNVPAFSGSSGQFKDLRIQSGATMTHSSSSAYPVAVGDIDIAGTYTQTGSGSLVWNPATGSKTINISGTATSLHLYKLGASTGTAASNMSINKVTVGGGKLDMASYSLSVADAIVVSSGTLDLGSSSGLAVGGHFTSGGTIDAGSSTLTFNGTGEQQITSNGGTFKNITVNKSGGFIKLMDKMIVSGTLTLTDGNLKTNSNILELTSETASDLTGFSNQSFIVAKTAGGALRRHINNSGSNSSTYTYPVGLASSAANYRRMDLTNNNLTGNGFDYLDVYVTKNAETGNNVSSRSTCTHDAGALTHISQEEWMMLPDAEPSSGSYSLKLYLANVTLGNSGTLQDNKFTIVKRPTGSTDFADYDSFWQTTTIPNLNTTGRLVSDGYGMRIGFTDFSGAGFGQGSDPLPIELTDFNATIDDGIVDLNWTTQSEVNNDFFTIERSKDAVDFEMIVTVPGAGTSNEVLYYESTDDNPIMGVSYYRLKQTDYDGQFTYSKIVAVKNLQDLNFNIMPNPTTERLTVTFGKVEGSTVFVMTPDYEAKIKIYNTEGKLVYKKKFDGTFYKFNIDVSQLPQGMYYVNLKANNQLYKANFLKQ
jgi:hypothetical protein